MKRAILISCLLLSTAGCHRSTANSPVFRETARMQDVSARHFELEYNAPRTPLSQWRYRGVVDGWHVLDYYGRGVNEQAEYYYSIRTRTYNLPKDFPSKPQPPVKDVLTREDEQYLDNIGHEILLDKQRRGDTGFTW